MQVIVADDGARWAWDEQDLFDALRTACTESFTCGIRDLRCSLCNATDVNGLNRGGVLSDPEGISQRVEYNDLDMTRVP